MTFGRRPRLRGRIALVGALVLASGWLAGTPAGAGDPTRDLEPAPPWIFFPEPDEATAKEIDRVVQGFADNRDKARWVRETLVSRFGLWSAPKIGRVLSAEEGEARNESLTWNAALTAYVLRDRLGNARELWSLVKPLTDLLDRSREPWRRAFAALALGSFHDPSFAPPPPERPDPPFRRPAEVQYQRDLEKGIAALEHHVSDTNAQVRAAVAFALAKSGAPSARQRLHARERLAPHDDQSDKTGVGRRAVLLAVGVLPEPGDEDLLLRFLADEERLLRQCAALAVALQALNDSPPAWTRSPRRLLRALTSPDIKMHLQDGAEAVFARGVFAALGLDTSQWRALFDLATTPSTEDWTDQAAAQCLLFCPEPWFAERARNRATRAQEGASLDPNVLAAFLLHLGSQARAEDIELCARYVGNRGRTPRAKGVWDVRYYAVIGLLRALAEGRVKDAERRHRIVAVLDSGVAGGLRAGDFRRALTYLLERERRRILEDSDYALPEIRVFALERTVSDLPGLLARDLRDVAVHRLNAIVPDVFTVKSQKPGVPGDRPKVDVALGFLEDCLQRFPYFTRLDLKADRGRRPWPVMPRADDPREEVRR